MSNPAANNPAANNSVGTAPVGTNPAGTNPAATSSAATSSAGTDSPGTEPLFPRCAGILLHPTSLPGPHGIGSLGEEARGFIDWLVECGASLWQVLPLVPPGAGWSPYATTACMAGNPWLIDLRRLVAEGLLGADVLRRAERVAHFGLDHVDFEAMVAFKEPLLRQATAALSAAPAVAEAFVESTPWVGDAALFAALKSAHGGRPWWEWEPALRDRDPAALKAARARLADEIAHHVGLQLLFERQWAEVRGYAAARGVRIMGDLPIYVDRDSVDVWAAREEFQLDPSGAPTAVAGVPPDYFSETGQLWGNPLYDWDRMEAGGYGWWARRLTRAFEQVDVARLDHFRAFASYWAVEPDAADARSGRWVPGPGAGFFAAIRAALGPVPIVAEDLGMLTDDVHELRDALGLPGMAILHFAFGGKADNAYLPHNQRTHGVVYSGTHDNDTSVGWWRAASERERDHLRCYLAADGRDVAWTLIRAALSSVSHTAVVPLQDLLALPSDARMNTPGVGEGNWGWRVRVQAFNAGPARRFRSLVELFGRLPATPA